MKIKTIGMRRRRIPGTPLGFADDLISVTFSTISVIQSFSTEQVPTLELCDVSSAHDRFFFGVEIDN